MGWQILPDPRCVCAPIQRASTASRPPFDFRSSPRRSYRTSSRAPDMNNRVLRDLMASQACPRGWGRRFASRERGDEAENAQRAGAAAATTTIQHCALEVLLSCMYCSCSIRHQWDVFVSSAWRGWMCGRSRSAEGGGRLLPSLCLDGP